METFQIPDFSSLKLPTSRSFQLPFLTTRIPVFKQYFKKLSVDFLSTNDSPQSYRMIRHFTRQQSFLNKFSRSRLLVSFEKLFIYENTPEKSHEIALHSSRVTFQVSYFRLLYVYIIHLLSRWSKFQKFIDTVNNGLWFMTRKIP